MWVSKITVWSSEVFWRSSSGSAVEKLVRALCTGLDIRKASSQTEGLHSGNDRVAVGRGVNVSLNRSRSSPRSDEDIR